MYFLIRVILVFQVFFVVYYFFMSLFFDFFFFELFVFGGYIGRMVDFERKKFKRIGGRKLGQVVRLWRGEKKKGRFFFFLQEVVVLGTWKVCGQIYVYCNLFLSFLFWLFFCIYSLVQLRVFEGVRDQKEFFFQIQDEVF